MDAAARASILAARPELVASGCCGQVGRRGCRLLGAGTGSLTPSHLCLAQALPVLSGCSFVRARGAAGRGSPQEWDVRPGRPFGSAWVTQTRPPPSWHKPWGQAGLEC